MTAEKRYVVGTLASSDYPQHLVSTPLAPEVRNEMAAFLRPTPDGRWSQAVNISWKLKWNRVVEFTGASGCRCIAREVDDPALIAQIDEAEEVVRRLEVALADARKARQETLAMLAARCKPALIEPAMFRVGGIDFTRDEMLRTNAEDLAVCAWLRRASVGDVYDTGHSERVERVS